MKHAWICIAMAAVVGVAAAVAFARKNTTADAQQSKAPSAVVIGARKGARPAGVKRIVNRSGAEAMRALQETRGSTEESRKLLAELTGKLESGGEDGVMEAVNAAPMLATPELLDFAERGLKNLGDRDARADIIQLLDGVPSKKALRLLANAAHDEDAYVRAEAIRSLALASAVLDETESAGGDVSAEEPGEASAEDSEEEYVDEEDEEMAELTQEQVAAALVEAVNDADPDVREAVLEAVKQLDADFQLQVLEAAVDSTYEDVRTDALQLLIADYNKETIVLTMKMLDDSSDALQSKARFYLEHLTGEPMESYADAMAWWKQNADRYDYDLVEKMDEEQDDADYAKWH